MTDLLFRGTGRNVGTLAPAWLVRLAGGALAVGIALVAEQLGLWGALGVTQTTARLTMLVIGVGIAPTRFGALLWLLSGLLTTLLLLVSYTPVAVPLARTFVRSDPRSGPPPDAIVVFANAVNSAGRLNGIALERLLSAIEEARTRGIRQMGLSVVGDEGDRRTPDSERDQRALLALAAPGIDARFVRNVFSSRDEALAFAALARTHGWRRVVVVTSPSHSSRACGSLEAVGLSVECRPSAQREGDLNRLDRPGNRRLAFADLLYESAATLLYRARGWLR